MTSPAVDLDRLKVGDSLPSLELPLISRLNLSLYCGASSDHNPIHVDTDFARAAGMADVFAHGMLSMAWLARLLTQWVPQPAIRDFSVRFAAITQVGERISCAGRVVELLSKDGERCARVEVATTNQDGQTKLAGEALIAFA